MESKEHSQMVMLTSSDTLSMLTVNNTEWMDESFFAQLGADRATQFGTIPEPSEDNLLRDFFVPSPNSFSILTNQTFPDSPQSTSSYVQSSPESSEVSYDSSPFSSSDQSPHFPQNSLKNSNSLLIDIDSISQQNVNNFNTEFVMQDDLQTHEMTYFEQLINQINTKELSLIPETSSSIDVLDCNPSKKRKRGEEDKITSKNDPFSVQNIQRPIFLDRQQLLQYSSKDFDDYKKKLLQTYTLSAEEKEILKKQRRVIKNREYSQNSRQKKKQRVEELELKIAQIEEENLKLRRENNSLKSKLLNIVSSYHQSKQNRTVVKTDPHAENNVNNNNNGGFGSFLSIKNANQKAMVGCVFIILLSFGFLFANHSASQLSKVKSSQTGRVVFSNSGNNENSILSILWQNSIGYFTYYYSEFDEGVDNNDSTINYKNRMDLYQQLNAQNKIASNKDVSTYYGSFSDEPHTCETPSDYHFLINSAFFTKNLTDIN